ncbi:GntR family transcriptional regulator [Microbacterium sp. NPDC003461]
MPVPQGAGVHRRGLLRDDVYTTIRDAIVRGDFEPGERIRDLDLVDWLGVSRTPIREAFLQLERAGLLESRPGQATIVAPLDGEQVRGAQEIAAVLHGLAVESAVPRLERDDLAAMEEANQALALALDAGDADAAIIADDAFHAVALGASGNPRIALLLEEVAPLVRRVERLRFASAPGRDSVRQHAEILALCAAGDAQAAADATRRNWRTLSQTLADLA